MYIGEYLHLLTCHSGDWNSFPQLGVIQQEEVQSLVPGEEQSQTPICAVEPVAAKQLCRKVIRGPCGHEVEHEPAMCFCGKEA